MSKFYSKWKGVKYKWGGTSMAGIDCSAFTREAFKKLHISLPRTTTEQIKHGTEVQKSNLKIGDLVFFKTTPQQRHVGIYVGNGKFMHASSSKGVTISSLDNPYWVEHYELSKRITS
ncbi:C40 family peptidase [Buttiauxella sp. A111]|uniref:C40 family peptidase n=1 Tax=Buttiauxella sp. A111 TaxID=2563088 RepID=UPI002103FA7D|nr:NlpC/P60 family protein [Buttiauxella sp. A111]